MTARKRFLMARDLPGTPNLILITNLFAMLEQLTQN